MGVCVVALRPVFASSGDRSTFGRLPTDLSDLASSRFCLADAGINLGVSSRLLPSPSVELPDIIDIYCRGMSFVCLTIFGIMPYHV